MKTLSTLKTLPLIGLLAMGLALVPAVSMADDDGRGRGKDKTHQTYDGGKSHHGEHHDSHYGKGHKHPYVRGHNKHVRHVHRPGHKHHSHKHHSHKHHGHRHTDYVVVHDRHYDYDPFRLMLGLHFDNIDIIYRDF